MALVRHGGGGGGGGEGPKVLAYDQGCGLGPTTWDFLTAEVWPGSSDKRMTGTILLFRDAGGLKVLFNDRDWGRVAFATLDTSEDIPKALEGLLNKEGLDWRVSANKGNGRR